jgi:hypothetical protein
MSDLSTEQRFRKVTDIAFTLLDAQRFFIDKENYALADNANVNGKALGYIYGVLDALLQSANLDIRGVEAEAALHSLIARLFPAEVGKAGTSVGYLKNMQNEPEIMNGVMLGGTDITAWLRHKSPPMLWATCFSEQLARLAEQRRKDNARSSDVQMQKATQELDREREQQLTLARNWILLFWIFAGIGVCLGLMAQLHLNFYISALLGAITGFLASRVLALYVGMIIGRRAARKLKNLGMR